jgi:hypothetical protein
MTVGKMPLKSGRRKQLRIVAQFPVESRFEAEGGNLQILRGITSNLHDGGVSCADFKGSIECPSYVAHVPLENGIRHGKCND